MSNNIFQPKSCLLYRKHEAITFEEYLKQIPQNFEGFILKTIDRDAVGRSGGSPRWCHVLEYKDNKLSAENRIAIYKEPDYDAPNGPYAEKLWSILGKLVLPNCKVPDIDIIEDERYPELPGVISYTVVNKEIEDMVDIRTVLRYNGITESEMKKNDDRIYIEDLLKYVKKFISNDEKYKSVEGDIIKAILMDCITNSFDRHPDNWALIYDSKTGRYKLGLYDNTVSFINVIDDRPGVVNSENWGKIFITVPNQYNKHTDMADEVVKYISKKYPEYFREFSQNLENNLEEFQDKIGEDKYKKVVNFLHRRSGFLKKISLEDREH